MISDAVDILLLKIGRFLKWVSGKKEGLTAIMGILAGSASEIQNSGESSRESGEVHEPVFSNCRILLVASSPFIIGICISCTAHQNCTTISFEEFLNMNAR